MTTLTVGEAEGGPKWSRTLVAGWWVYTVGGSQAVFEHVGLVFLGTQARGPGVGVAVAQHWRETDSGTLG